MGKNEQQKDENFEQGLREILSGQDEGNRAPADRLEENNIPNHEKVFGPKNPKVPRRIQMIITLTAVVLTALFLIAFVLQIIQAR